ncbi:efflux RND transporter periplasmic adaptor subunit [Stappia taiwanensis]|uniref:Efflux RND transporter periplasmic adaptor subunit n=1 Tax=Stappia taiwanensis TaxID=992267 RepID=A0A838XNB4_9HYPH|nr:efflux RND transporter periplasmic adaptor subunit [Stappia taiwanensis]MBA4611672.1 efflux RND transporter periplasmic adaptor subunit [Stappia taiwanensis]GGE97672.1 MexH family multidrug efflux RND transporter periplasmic adaptor subunit [Stappia taiwanensis]
MLKRILAFLFVLVILAACAGLIWFNVFRDKMIGQFFANMQRPTVTVSTLVVEPQDWHPGIEAIGTIVARQGVDVASRAPGLVREIHFKANDKVEAGALLVQLDDAVEQADLIAAKANLARDQQALNRAEALAGRGVSSASVLDNARAALDASRSLLERVKAQLDLKQIRAPFSGTIGIPRIDLGQYLGAGAVIATLQDLDTMKVDFNVPEGQIKSIGLGQTIRLGLDADHLDHTGEIIGIDPKADPNSRLVAVQAEVDNADYALRPGQFAAVRIELPVEKDLIALPQTAVVMSLYGSYVYAVREVEDEAGAAADAAKPETGTDDEAGEKKLVARQVFVKTGRRYLGMIEVTEGLKPGDVIVTAGQNKLSIGTPVRIDNTIDPSTTSGLGGGES